jgi:hypothetical protein
MKKNNVFLILSFLVPIFVFSQQWHAYSDSIISNINKNNYEKASRFVELADSDISNLKPAKDTIYADFIYRKGVLNYFQSKKSLNFLKESLSIWDSSNKKNNFKMMKIYYFLGCEYFNLYEYENAYINFEKCYLLNKENVLPKNFNFPKSIYYLSWIDYYINLKFESANQYAQEYIYYNKDSANLYFDFDYVDVNNFMDDSDGYEKTLLEFEKNYLERKLNNLPLFYKIINKLLNYYYIKSDFKGVIKYGEKSLEFYDPKIVIREQFLNDIYEMLENAYLEEGDKINAIKYQKLLKR